MEDENGKELGVRCTVCSTDDNEVMLHTLDDRILHERSRAHRKVANSADEPWMVALLRLETFGQKHFAPGKQKGTLQCLLCPCADGRPYYAALNWNGAVGHQGANHHKNKIWLKKNLANKIFGCLHEPWERMLWQKAFCRVCRTRFWM